MDIKEFFSRLLLHASYALMCLIGCLIIGEWLVPGSVLTHFNFIWLIPLAITSTILYHSFQAVT
ncbi:MAG: hypothetical protein Q8R07_03305 [Candidatus Uhrbacteria bacterium]|nr:hypothetical protein [Candidatus Uhrbacteria bacterium]